MLSWFWSASEQSTPISITKLDNVVETIKLDNVTNITKLDNAVETIKLDNVANITKLDSAVETTKLDNAVEPVFKIYWCEYDDSMDHINEGFNNWTAMHWERNRAFRRIYQNHPKVKFIYYNCHRNVDCRFHYEYRNGDCRFHYEYRYPDSNKWIQGAWGVPPHEMYTAIESRLEQHEMYESDQLTKN